MSLIEASISLFRRSMLHVPHVRKRLRYIRQDRAVIQIAALINPLSHERLQVACLRTAAYYPGRPVYDVLEQLSWDLARNDMTPLNLAFHHEYCTDMSQQG